MNDRDIQEIKDQLKQISEEIMKIKLLDVKQNSMLDEHIRRTEINEKRIELLQKAMWLSLGALICMEFLVKYVRI